MPTAACWPTAGQAAARPRSLPHQAWVSHIALAPQLATPTQCTHYLSAYKCWSPAMCGERRAAGGPGSAAAGAVLASSTAAPPHILPGPLTASPGPAGGSATAYTPSTPARGRAEGVQRPYLCCCSPWADTQPRLASCCCCPRRAAQTLAPDGTPLVCASHTHYTSSRPAAAAPRPPH